MIMFFLYLSQQFFQENIFLKKISRMADCFQKKAGALDEWHTTPLTTPTGKNLACNTK
jgi:hypothetical protein